MPRTACMMGVGPFLAERRTTELPSPAVTANIARGAAVLAVFAVVMDSDPTSFRLDVIGMAIFALIGFLLALSLLVWRVWRYPIGRRRIALRASMGTIFPLLVLVACLLLGGLRLPEQVRFKLSEFALQEAARHPGEWRPTPADPAWVGLYRVYGIRFGQAGRVHFDLGACGVLDTCEFVFDPHDEPARKQVRHETWQPARQWRLMLYPFSLR